MLHLNHRKVTFYNRTITEGGVVQDLTKLTGNNAQSRTFHTRIAGNDDSRCPAMHSKPTKFFFHSSKVKVD